MEKEEPKIEIVVSPEYITKMEKEGMWAANYGEEPEFPDCPYYMSGYRSVKK